MKKMLILLVMVIGVVLVGCDGGNKYTSNVWISLPDLNGYNEAEIKEELDEIGVLYVIVYFEELVEGYDLQFIMYENHDIGEPVNEEELVTVVIYPLGEDNYVLPDVTDLDKDEISEILNEIGINYYFDEEETTEEELDGLFIEYKNGYKRGDVFTPLSAIGVKVYSYEPVATMFFEPIDLVYDGPYLDSSFDDVDYMDPRGGYFEAPLNYCTDGDTAVFQYPTEIYDAITSGAKSVRFLNMDTEETYPGGEEEWGKPASKYTCSLLSSAESIVIQTDPNESLIDTHGRLLGWLWVKFDGEEEYFLLNYMVVRQGLAQVKYEFGGGETISYGNYTYNEWMHLAEDRAQNEELGQWGNLLDYYWDYENNEPDSTRW